MKRFWEKSEMGKRLPSASVWLMNPSAVAGALVAMTLAHNNLFLGSAVSDQFTENRKRYFYLGIYAALFGIYRIAAGVNRYKKTKYDDTVFGYEDRSEAKIIIISGLVLLSTALLAYISAEFIIPFVWWLKK
jgi:NADH:ubiquinone oxidoreductase subunit 2 (subunit N)